MYIKRHLENQITKASKYYPVVMVCGARQVGKSTLLNQNDPTLFFETYGLPILIDEFQRVPSILLEIKRIVDKKALNVEPNEGLFWLTGSQKFKMMNNVSDSLAGRIAVFDLSSLSNSEIIGNDANLFRPDIDSIKVRIQRAKKQNIHQVYKRIFQGGMPKINTTDIDRERYYSDYVNTYLERDTK